ncbi:MAG: hypothetical protein IJY79_01665 [Clostridia bacterium]|nr:hypothetical protein [Clostridia bacterium]
MKKCPFCHADIEDNARFCLYCMSSLQEKQKIENRQKDNKRWLYILAAILLFALVFVITIFALSKNEANNTSSEAVMQSGIISADNSSDTDGALSNDDASDNTVTDNSSQDKTEDNSSNTTTNPDDSSDTTTTTNNSQSSTISSSSSSTTASTVSPSPPQSSDGNNTQTEEQQGSTDTPTQNEVTYIYRTAKYGDDYSVAYRGSEDDIVITGVATVSESGVYVIPEQIDGKRVVAIMPLAFCGDGISDTVKKIVVPSSIKTIWDRAFVICYNLTDIYFCGSSLYTYPSAFADTSKRTGTLTIHCALDCNNRDLRYYKNIANSFYGAQYKEWNGGELE